MGDNSKEELVELILNHQGMDVISVDVNMANTLLNDPDEAANYVAKLFNEQKPSTSNVLCERNENVELNTEPSTSSNPNSLVWSAKRPTAQDNDATQLFLELRRKYASKFDDKKHVKMQIWSKIAKEMRQHGFNVGEGRESIEKLRMKFSNLQKQYTKHLNHMKRTGEEKRDPPPFFSEMHDIIGRKDKCNPQYLQDSEEPDTKASREENQQPMDAANTNTLEDDGITLNDCRQRVLKVKNRFSTLKDKKAESTNQQLVKLLQQQHEEDKTERRQQFERLERLLSKQNEQRDRLLNQFEVLIRQNKKRRRSDSDSSESD